MGASAGFLPPPARLVLVDDPEQVVAVCRRGVGDALEFVLQRDPQCLADSWVGAAELRELRTTPARELGAREPAWQPLSARAKLAAPNA